MAFLSGSGDCVAYLVPPKDLQLWKKLFPDLPDRISAVYVQHVDEDRPVPILGTRGLREIASFIPQAAVCLDGKTVWVPKRFLRGVDEVF